MRICDLTEEQIVVGLRVRSLVHPDNLGTVVQIDYDDDRYAWIHWDKDKETGQVPFSGFYGTDCECEVVKTTSIGVDPFQDLKGQGRR